MQYTRRIRHGNAGETAGRGVVVAPAHVATKPGPNFRRPRERGDPVPLLGKTLDSRLRGNDEAYESLELKENR